MMRAWSVLALTLLSVGLCLGTETAEVEEKDQKCGWTATTVTGWASPSQVCANDLIFADEFYWFNTDVWMHEHMGVGANNAEFQFYDNDRATSYGRDGLLFIKPVIVDGQPGVPGPIKSARIVARESFGFQFGRLEIRAKLPAGDWLWPALWMMPTYSVYGGWPTSGEIDLVESRGNVNMYQNGNPIGSQEAGSTLHWGPNWSWNAWYLSHFNRINWNGWHNDFHLYQMEWTPNYISFSYDNNWLGTIDPGAGGFWQYGGFGADPNLSNPWHWGGKMAPFDQHFYVIMNVAVGGHYFPDGVDNPHPKPWWNGQSVNDALWSWWAARNDWLSTWHGENAALQVDYVRIWALPSHL